MTTESSIGSVPGAEENDLVRRNTAQEVNQTLDTRMADRVRGYAARGDSNELSARIEELEQEWSIERLIETEASIMGLTGLGLGAFINRKFLAVPAFVGAMVLLHGVQGWYPMLPLFRRLGFRSREEIDREKFAMKVVRGDFVGADNGETASETERVGKALAAIRKS
ncbi:MAG TPA: hypothetical protein VFZ23_02140 [Pyrinomonadaceae bacterium]